MFIVTQADRDFTADWCSSYGPATADRIRDGKLDGLPAVQAAARHRLGMVFAKSDDTELLVDANSWYSEAQLAEMSELQQDAFAPGGPLSGKEVRRG